ncbi:MAG: hypothetical protein GXP15_17895 [Gammaproteobacteria bacterium]|nr:hypothetical protein [Gammaproteobacteria bacterium]
MNSLPTLANIAEIVGVVIVIGGLIFAMLQMRQLRQQRREFAAIELFRFYGNPAFAEAYQLVLQMPDGMSAQDIKSHDAHLENAAMLISTTMENIGVMTYQRIVPFQVVNSLIGMSAVLLWSKLDLWVVALRDDIDSPMAFEWFQWLAERLEQYQVDNPQPAYEAFKDWAPARLPPNF